MIDKTICPDCRHPVNCHHDGTGVWGKGCNQPLAMELQCPCQNTYATFNALNALAAELKQLRNIIAFYGIEIMPDGSFTSPRITQNEVDVKELREFVGAMSRVVIEEWHGHWQDGEFCFFDSDGEGIASGTDPFDAWQKMQGESK